MNTPVSTPVPAPGQKGQIHDLGYEPYRGTRLPESRRGRAIARNVVEIAWRSKWGVRRPVMAAGGITLIAAAVMYVQRAVVSRLHAGGKALFGADAVLFQSLDFYSLVAFLLAITVGCTTIAEDLRAGAFQFYFSRPIRTRTYVLGKLLGIGFVIALPVLGGPLVLGLLRLLFCETVAEAAEFAPTLWRVGAVGLVATAAYTLPAAGFGALLGRKRAAQAAYAVYYLVLGGLATGLSHALDFPSLRLLALHDNVLNLARALYGVDARQETPPGWASAAATLGIGALGYVICKWRVDRAETSGMGQG